MLNKITKPIMIKDLGTRYPNTTSKDKKRYGIFLCNCGKEFETQVSSIKSGRTVSCGCFHSENLSMQNKLNKTSHGMNNHFLYTVWRNMISRCYKSNNISFKNYGGRGIIVCDRWHDINNFIADMEPSYIEGLSIDRINTNGNYEPSNCRWSSRATQSRNTRKIYSSNTSGYRGVSFHRKSKKWKAQIRVNEKTIHIGLYENPKIASLAYDTFVIVYGLKHTCNFDKGIFND